MRKAGAGFSGTASAWEENSFAAFATEMTESLKKSRRPYLGSDAIFRIRCHGIRRLLAEQMVKTHRQQGRSEREAEAYFHLYVEV